MRTETPVNWHRVTALFGGTFDPPHLGHREAVRGLFAHPGVRRVLVIPTAVPPHKVATTSTDARLAMCRLAFSPQPRSPFPFEVEISIHEIERHKHMRTPSYTFDTLVALRREISELAFVIGADQVAQLTHWHRFPEILDLCHWIVLARKPHGQDTALATLQTWEGSGIISRARNTSASALKSFTTPGGMTLAVIETDAPDLSSTLIREALSKNGASPAGSLLPEVEAYLKENTLYGTKKSNED